MSKTNLEDQLSIDDLITELGQFGPQAWTQEFNEFKEVTYISFAFKWFGIRYICLISKSYELYLYIEGELVHQDREPRRLAEARFKQVDLYHALH